MLFCPNCGTKLEKSSRFCGSCGTPVCEQSERPEMLRVWNVPHKEKQPTVAIALGYPLGIDTNCFLIQCNEKIKKISFQKAAVWMGFNGIKEIEALNNEAYIFEELVSEGLLVKADSISDLFGKIKKIKPCRQGAGSVNDNKIAVFLGDRIIYPTPLQWLIWLQCDGKKTVDEIFSAVNAKGNIEMAEFIMAFNCLDEKDLLYLL